MCQCTAYDIVLFAKAKYLRTERETKTSEQMYKRTNEQKKKNKKKKKKKQQQTNKQTSKQRNKQRSHPPTPKEKEVKRIKGAHSMFVFWSQYTAGAKLHLRGLVVEGATSGPRKQTSVGQGFINTSLRQERVGRARALLCLVH